MTQFYCKYIHMHSWAWEEFIAWGALG